jgi:3-deoxy-D-manno-octulosonic-acid transferase
MTADPQTPLVLSTITPGGFAVATAQLSPAVPIYFPLDLRACVARALDAVRPRALLLVEREWWPTVIRLARARGVPVGGELEYVDSGTLAQAVRDRRTV